MPLPPPAFALWRDRNGRLSGLRLLTLAVLVAPAVLLLGRAVAGELGPRPIVEALRFCGDRAIETLIAAIAITPLRRLSGWSKLVGVRRMIGVASALWAVLHVALHVVEQGGDTAKIATEILVRPWLAIGFAALLGLLALAVTSTDGMIRRLGGPRWGRLHRLVHPIAILALVHVFLQVRLDPSWAATVVGLATAGLAVRIAAERGPTGAAAAAIAVFAGWAGAAASEVAWFAARTKRPLAPVVEGNVAFDGPLAASWVAAALVAAVAVTALAKRRFDERQRGARR